MNSLCKKWVGVGLAALWLFACGEKVERPASSVKRQLQETQPDGRGKLFLPKMGMSWGDPIVPVTPSIQVTHLGSLRHKELKTPLRIAAAAGGTLVVSDPRMRSLHLFTPDGTYVDRITLPIVPLGVAVDYLGRFIVGDSETGGVLLFNSTGSLLGGFCTGAGPFLKPNDIAIEPASGVVWIADSGNHRVVACGSEGGYIMSFGTYGILPGEFDFPTSVALNMTDGTVYVSDSNNGRVQVFDLAGAYQHTIGQQGSGPGLLIRSQGVALDGTGRIYVADVFESIVQAFSKEGAFLSWIGTAGIGEGEFLLPSDLWIDANNRLYVASTKTGRVEIYGIENYGNPVSGTALGAVAELSSPVQSFASAERFISLCLDVPDTRSPIAMASIRVAGTIEIAASTTTELDPCGGGNYEFTGDLSRSQLLGAYPNYGDYAVPVSGMTQDGSRFSGTFILKVSDEVSPIETERERRRRERREERESRASLNGSQP